MVDWINISQNSGSGNATITVTATSYSQLLERSTALTVRTATKSAVVGITQRFNNDFVVSPETINGVPYNSYTNLNYYYITITSNTSWNIVSGANWLSFNANSGSGSTTVSLLVQDNSGSARTGTVVFENANGVQRTLTVSQVAYNSEVTPISLYPQVINIPPSGGSQTINVVYDGVWSLALDGVWAEVSPYSDDPQHASGHGNTTLTITAEPNTGNTSRTVEIWVCDEDCVSGTVVQEGHYVGSYGSISPSALTFNGFGGTDTIYITSNVSWSLSVDSNFVTLSSYNGMSGTSIPVTVTAEENNYSSARTASITLISQNNNEVFDSVIVSQQMHETPYITLATNIVRFPSTGGTVYIPYTSNVVPTVSMGTGYVGNPSATVDAENNRIIITSTGNTIGASFNSVQTGDFYVQFNGRTYDYIMHSTEITCQDVLTTTTTYNNNSTGKMLLFHTNPSTLNSVTIDGNQVNIDDLEIEFGWADEYAVSYIFNTIGEHTVVTTAIVPQQHTAILALETASLSGSYLSYNNFSDDYGGCSNLTGFTWNLIDTSCTDKRHDTMFPSLAGTNISAVTIPQYVTHVSDYAFGSVSSFGSSNITAIIHTQLLHQLLEVGMPR